MSHDPHHSSDDGGLDAGQLYGIMMQPEHKPMKSDPSAPAQPPVHEHTTSNREVLTVVGVSTGLVLAFLWFMGALG